MELIVLQALVLAHERLDLYGHLLNSVRSVIFFGVPHRGSDVAFWAAFAASLLQHALLGFRGNPTYVESLKRNSKTFADISRQFVARGAKLQIRTFYETIKMGNQLAGIPPLVNLSADARLR